MTKFAKHHKIFTGFVVFFMLLFLFVGAPLSNNTSTILTEHTKTRLMSWLEMGSKEKM
jgi:hypothetical protein